MATDQTIQVSVGFMTNVPSVGHLEYVIHYKSIDGIPSQDVILTRITPYVLRILGGNEDEWIINKYEANEEERDFSGYTYTYKFEWKDLNNKERICPIMRTISFRRHLHRFELII